MSEITQKPVVAIVGRPNVGKSTLFNRLAGRRLAIVEETPGITRDRLYADCEWQGKPFALVDTGGWQTSKEPLLEQVRAQARLAMQEADLILLVVDAREGLTSLDYQAAELLRKAGRPVILVANKADTSSRAEGAVDFHALAMGQPVAVSSLHGLAVDDLLDRIWELIPQARLPEQGEQEIAVAIVGRPNVGKSSLLNAVVGQPRAIVSEAPGTTRDALDTPFVWKGHPLRLIDTAGIRRKAKVKQDFEYYAVLRALAAISRCQVALLLLDATEGVADQDKRIAGHAHEEGRALVIGVNKWDLVQEKAEPLTPAQRRTLIKDFTRILRHQLVFADYAPVAFISALHHQGLEPLMDTVISAAEAHSIRVPTPELNRLIHQAADERGLSFRGRELKVYYATQIRTAPPTIALFVNDPKLAHFSHLRFLENRIRSHWGLEGTPLRLAVRQATGKQRRDA